MIQRYTDNEGGKEGNRELVLGYTISLVSPIDVVILCDRKREKGSERGRCRETETERYRE